MVTPASRRKAEKCTDEIGPAQRPGKGGPPALEERLHPGLGVPRAEHVAEGLALDLHALRRPRRPDRPLDPAQGERRLPGEPNGVVARPFLELLRLDEEVHDPRLGGLLGRELEPLHDQLGRAARSDQARQPLGTAGAGKQAEPHLGQPEQCAFGAGEEAEVAGERKLEPASERVAVDRGDGRLGQLGERGEDVLAAQGPLDAFGRDPLELGDVCPRHEDAVERAPNEYRPDVVVGGEPGRGPGELGHHLLVDRVQRRPLEGEHRDPLLRKPLDVQDLSRHA